MTQKAFDKIAAGLEEVLAAERVGKMHTFDTSHPFTAKPKE